MANIAVFCWARDAVNQHYIDASWDLGNLIAHKNHTLIYGWWIYGLMGWVYRGMNEKWGKIVGVIPWFLMKKERGDELSLQWVEVILTDTMDERKTILFNRSDVVIVWAGWVGTLDEFFEAWNLVKLSQKKHTIGILNTFWYYDYLIQFIEHMITEGFVDRQEFENISIATTPEELFEKMKL